MVHLFYSVLQKAIFDTFPFLCQLRISRLLKFLVVFIANNMDPDQNVSFHNNIRNCHECKGEIEKYPCLASLGKPRDAQR